MFKAILLAPLGAVYLAGCSAAAGRQTMDAGSGAAPDAACDRPDVATPAADGGGCIDLTVDRCQASRRREPPDVIVLTVTNRCPTLRHSRIHDSWSGSASSATILNDESADAVIEVRDATGTWRRWDQTLSFDSGSVWLPLEPHTSYQLTLFGFYFAAPADTAFRVRLTAYESEAPQGGEVVYSTEVHLVE